jgi:Uma2 family endonuclease
MATVSQNLITAEEFFRMPSPPDGSQQELVQGRVITMPPPGGRQGVCCLKLGRRIGNFVEEHQLGTVTSNDTGFITERNPDTVRGPDLSYWSRDRLPQVAEGYIDIPPDLAVEIISPTDHYSRIQQKVRHYLNCGVRLASISTVLNPPTIFEEEALALQANWRNNNLFPNQGMGVGWSASREATK